MTTRNNDRHDGTMAARRHRARQWTSREGSWAGHTKRWVSVTEAAVDAVVAAALGSDALEAFWNAPGRVEAFTRSRTNVVQLKG